MKRIVVIILILSLASFLTGCGPHHFSIDKSPATSLSLDASKRLVLVTDNGGPVIDEDKRPLSKRKVICAEPSPDVFTTLALGAELKTNSSQGSPEGSVNFSQTAAALGMRTQTIQLLRDGLYRACEAYLNGVLNDRDYNRIIAGYDEVMITTLAIEGLTQQVPPVLPSIGAEVKKGKDSNQLTEEGNPSPAKPNTEEDKPSPTQSPSGRAQINPDLAKQVTKMVRDYYCFQLGLKQIFYHQKALELYSNESNTNGLQAAHDKIINHLCSDAPL